jgi:hypothetical protein
MMYYIDNMMMMMIEKDEEMVFSIEILMRVLRFFLDPYK